METMSILESRMNTQCGGLGGSFPPVRLRILSNDCIVYNDECEDGPNQEDSRWQEGNHNERVLKTFVEQQYSLSPNPNSGLIQLRQKVANEEPVNVQIYNVVGQRVFDATVLFSKKLALIHVDNIAPGLYSLKLRETTGNSYTLSFIKK